MAIDSYKLDPATGMATFYDGERGMVTMPATHPAAQQKMQTLDAEQSPNVVKGLGAGLAQAGASLMGSAGAKPANIAGPLSQMLEEKKKHDAAKADQALLASSPHPAAGPGIGAPPNPVAPPPPLSGPAPPPPVATSPALRVYDRQAATEEALNRWQAEQDAYRRPASLPPPVSSPPGSY